MAEQVDINIPKLRRYVIIGVAVLALIIIIKKSFIILQPTERGVVFYPYSSTGLNIDDVKGQGLSLVAPWNQMIIFDVEEQQIEETMDVLSVDGLSISIDVSLRFKPIPDQIGYLYEQFKTSYAAKLIRPELRSAVRQIVGQYTPEELYATKRQEIETKIEDVTRTILTKNNIELKALLFRSIKLPSTIKTAIEDKLKADQEAQKFDYLLIKETKEAERRRIDAEGKAAANKILSASLTDKILTEKGILATEALAKSPNSKVIVIGSGDGGLPIILGGNN